MRKGLSLILALSLMVSCVSVTFALGASVSDIKGTAYEDAVTELILKGVISGYPDGTYRPDGTITRAEACAIIVKSINPTALDLKGQTDSGFTDMLGYGWASEYVDYAVVKGVVKGYPDGYFRPYQAVTYSELATMLVLAMGYKNSDLSGVWPDNFMAKATQLGVFKGISNVGSASVSRGFAAIMDYNVLDQIIAANAVQNKPPTDTGTVDSAGRLANFSGRAYGMLLDTAKVLDSKGDVVDQIEFLIGASTVYVNTNGKFAVSAPDQEKLNGGDLFGLQMSGGIVKNIGDSTTSFAAIGLPVGYDNLGVTQWVKVNSINDTSVTVTLGGISVAKTIIKDASFYVAVTRDVYKDGIKIGAVVDSYEAANLGDIDRGDWIRLYSVTGDEPGCAEVVVIAKEAVGIER